MATGSKETECGTMISGATDEEILRNELHAPCGLDLRCEERHRVRARTLAAHVRRASVASCSKMKLKCTIAEDQFRVDLEIWVDILVILTAENRNASSNNSEFHELQAQARGAACRRGKVRAGSGMSLRVLYDRSGH